jgi:hypothetical protein
MSMIQQARYERVAAYFRKLAGLALGIMVLGALAGLAIGHNEARVIVWIIAGILAVGTIAISVVESYRYQRATEFHCGSREVRPGDKNG